MFTDATLHRRMQRVRVLLETHDDAYEDALSRRESAGALPGFSDPKETVETCGVCGGTGCGRCDDIGTVRIENRDPYDNGKTGFWAQEKSVEPMTPKEVEDELDRLRDQELTRAGVYAQDVPFLKALKRAEQRDRHGSYAKLRAALDFLPASCRGEDALRWLAEHIPGQIKIPRWAYEAELEGIEAEVVELKNAGYSRTEIAEALDVPAAVVRTAIRRSRPTAPLAT